MIYIFFFLASRYAGNLQSVHLLFTIAHVNPPTVAGKFAKGRDAVMSRIEPTRTSAQQQRADKHRQEREALIEPLTAGLQALWSNTTRPFTSDEIHLLQLMSTLVRLSDLDVLQSLRIANEIMPPNEPWDS
jgi:hypothetical protein